MKNIFGTFLTSTIIISMITFSSGASPRVTSKYSRIYSQVSTITNMIKAIKPKLGHNKAFRIAQEIYSNSKYYHIDPKVMIAIIDTESDFDNTKISNTGDLSLAQINTKVWNKELKRLKLPKIDSSRLKIDEKYALNKMAMILSIIKDRHAHKDKKWFARYHSRTKKHKNVYLTKVDSRMRKIASIQ